jgi:hypothetical protein
MSDAYRWQEQDLARDKQLKVLVYDRNRNKRLLIRKSKPCSSVNFIEHESNKICRLLTDSKCTQPSQPASCRHIWFMCTNQSIRWYVRVFMFAGTFLPAHRVAATDMWIVSI